MTQQPPSQASFACSQCGRTFAQSDLVPIAGNWVCGDCKTAFLSRVVAGNTSPTNWHYGGFWIRFVARMIDGFILLAMQLFIGLLFFGSLAAQFLPNVARTEPIGRRLVFQFLTYFIGFAYEVLFLKYRGATPGKIALGLKVVRSDGGPLGWGISVARYFMYIVSGIILAIGDIMAGFDTEKRALHDRVCDTRVVYKRNLA